MEFVKQQSQKLANMKYKRKYSSWKKIAMTSADLKNQHSAIKQQTKHYFYIKIWEVQAKHNVTKLGMFRCYTKYSKAPSDTESLWLQGKGY